ncbi:flagellar hook-associated protein FlgK [Jatrophihabitans endophyticus]|uniref:flagellar hook-associated protein FlgK n=1 Tax=Jatrophihabitans endophyticus TaxID=1206085 RepID=UPI001A04B4B6|nr:flagellar hook-associated protein FlgK [Jatrophihabitans endophyticus]MBE7188747.1 flagellar hook-associated protein FlgK [Jatrophihabitans endophyticus]
MSLNGVLSIASSGLAAVQAQLAVSSQNVANAGTSGYVAERLQLSSRASDGTGSGVVIGLTTRVVDAALQDELYNQNAAVSDLQTRSDALGVISALQGSTTADPGSTGTLSDGVGNVRAALITLEADPSNATGQQAVVSAAAALASTIRQTAAAYQTQRQGAQDGIVTDVGQANADLQLIGKLSSQIMRQRQQDLGTADLENQRAAAMGDLSGVMAVTFTPTPSGDMEVRTASGITLPTRVADGPLQTAAATVGVANAYPDSLPAITLAGQDITTRLTGGSLGARIALRDDVLPTMQAELDSFSQGLAGRFDAQGLTLFSAADGTVPGVDPRAASPAGQLGFSQDIGVNPAVSGQPSEVRDGSHDVVGSSTGAGAFTINADRGSADPTLIGRLVSFALGSQVQDGVAQPALQTGNLGATGTLRAPYTGTADLATLASTLTGSQGATIAANTTALTSASAIQGALGTRIAAVSGVSVDDEMASMVSLQNAYAANAKVVGAVQSMFSALLSAIN